MKNPIFICGLISLIILGNSCKKEAPDPPVITSSIVIEISYTTATAGGNVTSEGGAAVTSRGVCWNTTKDPTIDNSKTTETGSTGEFISKLTQLNPNTLYYVRAYATNSGGTSYGSEVTFTTSKIEVPVLNTEAVTSIAQTSAVSGGNITDEKGSPVTARGVCWSTNQNPTISDAKSSDGTGPGTYVSNITGLTGNTVYYIRAYATNIAGTQYGTQVSFKTSPVLASLTTDNITYITYTSAHGGGYITNDGGSNVTERGICWNTAENPTVSNNKSVLGTGTGPFENTITGLTAGTTYFLRAYAINSVGTSYGAQVTFSTKQITPPALSTTSIKSVTVVSAKTEVLISEENGASVTSRGVCWSTSSNPTVADNKNVEGTGTGSFTSTLNGLTGNTKYYVRAFATNSAGTSYGNELTFTTFTVTDVDGNLYSSVTINSQTWLVENLKTTKYDNGDPIPNVIDQTVWNSLSSGAYCNYNNDVAVGDVYGKLYNYYTVVDSRKLCPSGWHVPSKTEFQTLVTFVGNTSNGKLREKGDAHWIVNPPTAPGTDDYGFKALPGGDRHDIGFYVLGSYGVWWSTTHEYTGYSTVFQLSNNSDYINVLPTKEIEGNSVRCLKD